MEGFPHGRPLNREDLAWAAGLICGEGCFTSHGLHSKPYPRFVMAQKDPEILWDFYGIIGYGNIGPVKRKVGSHWNYEVNGFERTQYIACLTWHYLSTQKRDQYRKVMMDYHKNGRKGKFNGGIRKRNDE